MRHGLVVLCVSLLQYRQGYQKTYFAAKAINPLDYIL